MPLDFDSYGLDDTLKEKIKADYEADISGLKAKNSDLIEREKAAKLLADETALKSAKAEEDAKVALAEKEGDIGKYKAAVAERDEKLATITLEFKQKENERVADMAVNDFVNANISSDPAAKAYMESIFRKNIDVVDGVIKPKDITKSLEDLQKGLISDESYSNYIKADVGSGSGSQGSSSTSPAGSEVKNERAEAAKAKGDLNGFISESIKV